jgi:hypothetical protein
MFGKPDYIEIDGDFEDWRNVPMYADMYTDQVAYNVNLVKYAVTTKGDDLSFYVEVAGDILKGIEYATSDWPLVTGGTETLGGASEAKARIGEDAVHIFVDLDRNVETGYLIGTGDLGTESGEAGIGAEVMFEIYGHDCIITEASCKVYNGDSKQPQANNQLDWNIWDELCDVPVALSGSKLETQVSYQAILPLDGKNPNVLIRLTDVAGNEDYSDYIIAPKLRGALRVTIGSIAADIIEVGTKNNPVLKIDLLAVDGKVKLESIRLNVEGTFIERNIAGLHLYEDTDGTYHFSEGDLKVTSWSPESEESVTTRHASRVPRDPEAIIVREVYYLIRFEPVVVLDPDEHKLYFVTIDIAPDAVEKRSIGFSIEPEGIKATTPVTLVSDLLVEKRGRSYIGSAPADIVIDGAFADWEQVPSNRDTDDMPVPNKNIDIVDYRVASNGSKLSFYCAVEQTALGGCAIPVGAKYFMPRPEPEPVSPEEIDRDLDKIPDYRDEFPLDFDNDGIPDSEDDDDDNDGVPDIDDDYLDGIYRPLKPPVEVEPGLEKLMPPEIIEKIGEDTVAIFIDSDNDDRTGYLLSGIWTGEAGIGADWLVEIKGKYGMIISSSVLEFIGMRQDTWAWNETRIEVVSACGGSELEAQVDLTELGLTGNFTIVFKSADWFKSEDWGSSVLKSEFGSFRTEPGSDEYYTINLHDKVREQLGNQDNDDGTGFGNVKSGLGEGRGTGSADPYVLNITGFVYQSGDGSLWTKKDRYDETYRYTAVSGYYGNGSLTVFVTRADGKIYYTSSASGGWAEWGTGGGAPSDCVWVDVAVTYNTDDSALTVFILRADGKVWYCTGGSGSWQEWETGGGAPEKDVSTAYCSIAAYYESGIYTVYVLRNDGKIWYSSSDGGGWGKWGTTSGLPTSTAYVDMAVRFYSATSINAYLLRANGKVYYSTGASGGWSQWGIGSPPVSSSTAYVSISGHFLAAVNTVFILNADGTVYHCSSSAGGWGEWGVGTPAKPTSTGYLGVHAEHYSPGYASVFVLRTNGEVYSCTAGPGGWSQWGSGSPELTGGAGWMAISNYDQTIVFALKSDGSVYKSTDGGGTWTAFGDFDGTTGDCSWVSIAACPDGYIYGMKNDGTIKRSTVGTWALDAGEGDAGSDSSWIALCSDTIDAEGRLYALRNDGKVTTATASDWTASPWTTKAEGGNEDYSWVSISASGSYVYALRNDRKVNQSATGTGTTWSSWCTSSTSPSAGDASWVGCAAGLTGYVFFLRNDGRVDRSDDASAPTNFQTVHDAGTGVLMGVGYLAMSAYVWISEYTSVLVPVIIVLIILCIFRRIGKHLPRAKARG